MNLELFFVAQTQVFFAGGVRTPRPQPTTRLSHQVFSFCIWEDAKVWAHWSHSFDMHLSSIGPASCILLWTSSGYLIGDGQAVADCLMTGILFQSWVCSRFTVGGGCNVMAWWLQQPLFTDVVGNIFFHSHRPYSLLLLSERAPGWRGTELSTVHFFVAIPSFCSFEM